MKKYLSKALIVLAVIGIFVVIYKTGIYKELTFQNLQDNAERLETAVANNYLLFAGGFILSYILVAGLSIPGAVYLTLASGLLFGSVLGTVYVNIGATCGATLVFLFARYVFGESLQNKYPTQLAKFNRELDENGTNYLLTLRLIPAFPFWMVNLFAGLTKVPLTKYIWTTSIGILPGSFVYAYAGRQLKTIESAGDILSGNIILAFVFLGILAVLPVLIKKMRKKSIST